MSIQIQSRRDTAANWTSANPTLANGELGLETDTGMWKVGDGSTAWTALAYGPVPRSYVDQPQARTEAGAVTLAGSDVGGVVMLTGTGAQALGLGDLSASLVAGKAMLLTLQATGAATAPTITLSGGATIDGSGSAFVMDVGRARLCLISIDGLAWYSGTP